MKSKVFIFPVAVAAFLLFGKVSLASYDYLSSGLGLRANNACNDNFWSDKCQKLIHERDYINDLRQIPRGNDYDYFTSSLNLHVDEACNDNFWSDKCQKLIHERDYINDLRQVPRENEYGL